MARRSFDIPPSLLAGAKVTTVNAAALGAAPTTDNSPTLHVQVNPRRQEVVIRGLLPPTTNALMRRKIGDRIRLGRAWRLAVCHAAKAAGIRSTRGKRRVVLVATFGPGRRFVDVDAFLKSTLDAMTHAGMIRGDRYRDVELAPVVYLRGDRTETRLIVEDLPG